MVSYPFELYCFCIVLAVTVSNREGVCKKDSKKFREKGKNT